MDAQCSEAEFLLGLERTVNRLRNMELSKLAREGRIEFCRVVLANLADPLVVPELHPSALGDQLWVLGREFCARANEEARADLYDQISRLRAQL